MKGAARVKGGAVALLVGATLLVACVPPGPSPQGPAEDLLVPAGFGSLRQDDITLTLRVGEVQVKVTPLAEWVIRLTAPDTYKRLTGAAARLPEGRVEGRATGARLPVLVSVYTAAPGGAAFEPRSLTLSEGGRTYRPEDIRALTPGWGVGRLEPRRTEQAVYAFSGDLTLRRELVVAVASVRDRSWAVILPQLDIERARVRARVGS